MNHMQEIIDFIKELVDEGYAMKVMAMFILEHVSLMDMVNSAINR